VEKKTKQSKDDRDVIPVSDLDEEESIPMVVMSKNRKKNPLTYLTKAPEQNLGYR
jgi:hypothetical protein